MRRATKEAAETAYEGWSDILPVRKIVVHSGVELPSLPRRVLDKLRSARLASEHIPSAKDSPSKAA